MNLTTEMRDYRLIFKDKDQKNIYLTSIEAENVKYKWNKRTPCIEIEDITFSYQDIKRIERITQEDRERIINAKTYKSAEEAGKRYLKEMDEAIERDREKFSFMSPQQKQKYAEKNPCQSFQFEFELQNPNSSIKQKIEAFKIFVRKNPKLQAPNFLKK